MCHSHALNSLMIGFSQHLVMTEQISALDIYYQCISQFIFIQTARVHCQLFTVIVLASDRLSLHRLYRDLTVLF